MSPRLAIIISPSISKNPATKSCNGPTRLATISNIKYIIITNIGRPNILLVTILSIFSLMVGFAEAGLVRDSLSNPPMYAYLAFAITSSLPSPKMPFK